MADFRRKRRHLRLPIWSSVVLAALNISLMVVLIVQLAQQHAWLALVLGSIALGISLFGITFYSFLTIKEIQLNRRQANFVDSVTHELKTPIAALKLYLDTLQLRDPGPEDRQDFYQTMGQELERLDHLISQLLEVGRLDALGTQSEPEDLSLPDLLRSAAELACRQHRVELSDAFSLDSPDIILHERRLLVEMIFRNLLDNAFKYGGNPPMVRVQVRQRGRDRVAVRIQDNGSGVPRAQRSQVFQMFFRGNDELQRTRKGTGLGLYIVRTLVSLLKGRITVLDSPDGTGSVFEVILPGVVSVRSAGKDTADEPAAEDSEPAAESVGAAR